MNILLIMDPGIPVPPLKYGGIERIVFQLANAYAAQGHEVTLLAGPGSYCPGKTVPFGINKLNCSMWSRLKAIAFVWTFLVKNYYSLRQNNRVDTGTDAKFDLIHNFGRLIYLLPVLRTSSMKIMSYQRKITARNIRFIQRSDPKNMWFTACSDNCRHQSNFGHHNIPSAGVGKADGFSNPWQTIYNAVDFSEFEPNTVFEEEAPLMFLGRLDRIKGAHTAIEVAKRSGNKLWIAGNIPGEDTGRAYYKEVVYPQIDGSQIKYLGELDDKKKNYYLARSKALLFPIEWEEPFGIVMIEAMACGTPVIAFNKGSVPEVLTHGETGFIVENVAAMCDAIPKLSLLNRKQCRDTASAQFDISIIADKYLQLAGEASLKS
jgi:glycosyltransferase involved in cell wall biosynthesis